METEEKSHSKKREKWRNTQACEGIEFENEGVLSRKVG